MAPRPRSRHGKVIYTDADRARAYQALIATGMDRDTCDGGVIGRVAKNLAIPHMTLKGWVLKWREEGPPEVDLGDEDATILSEVERFDDLIERGLIQMERLIPNTNDLGKLSSTVKILLERRSILKGEATTRTEIKHVLPTPDEIRELLAPLASHTIAEARIRAQEIIDVTCEEEPVLGLPTKT
jgi:hypothetical protein